MFPDLPEIPAASEGTILIVEDNDKLREAWVEILNQEGFSVVTASHGAEALEHMHSLTPDLIISDVAMPEMNGYEFYNAVRSQVDWVTIPFIFLTSRAEPEHFLAGRNLGADDYLTKPISRDELVTTIRSRLGRFRQVQLAQIQNAYQDSLTTLANAIEMRDPSNGSHIERMTEICQTLAYYRGWHEKRILPLRFGAILHDIGKIQIPATILFKMDPLDDADWAEIRRHTIIGAEMLKGIPMLEDAIPIVRSHHERWDGKGYPDRLSGNDIPEGARIISLADAFDAMTSPRPYHATRSLEDAYQEILSLAGENYDPAIVLAFQYVWREGRIAEIYRK